MRLHKLQDLLYLLDEFKHNYPHHVPEGFDKLYVNVMQEIARTPSDTALEEKDSCRLFDSGRFNDIALAYMMLSLKAAEVPEKKATEALAMMYHAFDELHAEEALTRYRNTLPGAPE